MSYSGFEGVNTLKTHSGDESISLIENFRITDDKSLKKRCGFKLSCEAPSTISQAFRCAADGKEFFYLITESVILKYTPSDNAFTKIADMPDCSSAYFFEHLGSNYLCTDAGMYLITNGGLAEPDLYIPLYGKDWPSSYPAEINEPVNLLCNKVIISYKFGESAYGFLSKGDLKLASIDVIYRNGEVFPSEKYYYDDVYDIICLREHSDYDEFVAILTVTPDEKMLQQREELLKTKMSSVFYELNNHDLLLWGNPSSNNIFYSRSASPDTLKLSARFDTTQGSLYLPVDSFFSVDKKINRIKSIIRHYDRVLIMTDSSTWMTNLQELGSKDFHLKSINASLGCSTLNGAVRINNSVISLGTDSAYCWTSQTDELNECNAYKISQPIESLLPKSFFCNCLIALNQKDSEIWFHHSSSRETWIYNAKHSAWYKYTGFAATRFLESESSMIFANGSKIYYFDQSLLEDPNDSIIGRLKSGELEFNTHKYKKLTHIAFRGDFSSGNLLLTLLIDNEKTLQYYVNPSTNHFILPFRIKTGSFKALSFELTTHKSGEQILHGLNLYAT